MSVTITKGANKSFLLTVVDENGAAADLAGAKIWVTVKHRQSDAVPVISKRNTAAGGGDTEVVVSSPSTLGKATVLFVPTDTSPLSNLQAYEIDAWVELATGKRYQVVAPEAFTIDPTITTTF